MGPIGCLPAEPWTAGEHRTHGIGDLSQPGLFPAGGLIGCYARLRGNDPTGRLFRGMGGVPTTAVRTLRKVLRAPEMAPESLRGWSRAANQPLKPQDGREARPRHVGRLHLLPDVAMRPAPSLRSGPARRKLTVAVRTRPETQAGPSVHAELRDPAAPVSGIGRNPQRLGGPVDQAVGV